MKIRFKLILVILLSFFFIYCLIYFNTKYETKNLSAKSRVSIAVVVCGEHRVDEAIVMIKSALLFVLPKTSLNFVVVTEENLKEIIEEKLKNLRKFKEFSYEIFKLKFPEENREIWLKLFKPCAAQRLFLPSLLPHIDSLVYVDCDVLFLTSPEYLEMHFSVFTPSQIAALAPESGSSNTGWYTRFARHPFYGQFGLNSGVMLMNLTRMRERKFEAEIPPIYEKFKSQLAWGDQDLLNIYFNQHPNEVFELSCDFNYRPDHCMYTSQCGIKDGVKVLHGNRGYFHKLEGGKQGIFREIFKAIEEFDFTSDPCTHIVRRIESQVSQEEEGSNCNELVKEFLHIPKKHFCQLNDEVQENFVIKDFDVK